MKNNLITRRNFLTGMTATAAASVLPATALASPEEVMTPAQTPKRKGPHRGVSFYSYSAEFGFEKNLEDCFEDV